MGEVGILGISSTLSLNQSSYLEETQAELRKTFTAADKFRRELEFLQKGGNPLDLTAGSDTSVSVQSTSLTHQHPEPFVTSEVKGSFLGDSVGSSARLEAPSVCGPDNHALLNGDNKFDEVEKRYIHSPKSNITSLERYIKLHSDKNGKESGDTVVSLEFTKKSYKRRVRSRPNREGARNPLCVDTHRDKSFSGQTNGFGSTSEFDNNENNNELTTKEIFLASNEVPNNKGNNLVEENKNEILKIANNNNVDDTILIEDEGLKASGLTLQNESKDLEGSTVYETESKLPNDVSEQVACSKNNMNLASQEYEDSILKEARIIEEKHVRVAELLSVSTFPLPKDQNSQWDFLLEEMSWLANDFAQERLWKVTAAAQISKRVAFASQIRYQKQNSSLKQKQVAKTLSGSVMEFWHTIQVKCMESELQSLKTDPKQGLQGYALRFLEYNSTHAYYNAAQGPLTLDMMFDEGIIDISLEDYSTEENLVYTVPPGAIEAYRKSIESHLVQCERQCSFMQEEVDTSAYDAIAENLLEEDDEEPRADYASKPTKQRRKNFRYETGSDVIRIQPSVVSRKRHGSNLNVSFPTKHVRTALRQRVVGPFTGGNHESKTKDASSGDNTDSFQDEQIEIRNNMEVESVDDYENQFDSVEELERPRKKNKVNHTGSSFNHRWPLDSKFQNGQKDHSRRRLAARQQDSNGNNVTSQVSNMSNPKKFAELLVRDRVRKSKTQKISVWQPGSGSPWSLYEDQYLVVLVHDMGPNWELISDAINSSLQSKCIFRNAKECKERHKFLMDRKNGNGADSAKDSRSSQPYTSMLPKIPEGSARQVFKRVQGPMEEEILKSHFEKIIEIGRKQYYRRTQDNEDSKQLLQPHGSHTLALSQVSPNNLNRGLVLTPLELCDAIESPLDAPPVGHQDPHLHISDQPNGAAMLRGPSSTSSYVSFPLNPELRKVRYGIPKTASLPKDDEQRVQRHNQQMLPCRNSQHFSVSSVGSDCMLPTGNGGGVMSGMNRNLGITRRSMLNSGNALSSGMTMPNPVNNMQPRAGQGPGNLMSRPPNPMPLMRPNQNSRGVPPQFASGMTTAFRMRLIKEKQIQQQRALQQQQQQILLKQQNQFQPMQQTKLMKQQNLPIDSFIPNGLSGDESKEENGLIRGVNHAVDLSQPRQQKTSYSGQTQKPCNISDNNHGPPQRNQKLVNSCEQKSTQKTVNKPPMIISKVEDREIVVNDKCMHMCG